MDKELELESEKYVNQSGSIPTTELEDAIFKQGFIDGATSKWVEKQKLEFAIKELMWVNVLIPFEHKYAKDCINEKIKELEQKISEL